MAQTKEFAGLYYREGALDPKTMQLVALAALRPLAARHGLSLPPPRRAGQAHVSDAHARRVQAQFGPSAAAYVASTSHAGGDDLERLLAWVRACRPGRALDVATGGGHTALALAGVAREVVAFDLTEPMLRAARAVIRSRGAATVRLAAGAGEAVPFRDGAFDAVTCRIAAHHFANVAAAIRQGP